MRKKSLVLSLIAGAVLSGSFAFSPAPEHNEQDSTLKVLPKDISDEELMQVMHSFEVALGMNCGDCHTHSAADPNKMDWSADTEQKQTTIAMMKMVQEINEKHFGAKGDFKENYLRSEYAVSCNTCHNGHEHPNNTVTLPVPEPEGK
ncbi:MAG: c-type cytochrome [Flavobacteriales bacterium]|nr:c-type cytochrome [Flavobacteriales bacterium]MBP9080304.1 c-type cytochrome [Flavobacteriales bacterium]